MKYNMRWQLCVRFKALYSVRCTSKGPDPVLLLPPPRWQTLTAEDKGFGRIDLPHAVTGSNLFKYAEPYHGVVLFKHHDPLQFSSGQLADLLRAGQLWFEACQRQHGGAPLHPFYLWNCLPRAGASQYHGHAQVRG